MIFTDVSLSFKNRNGFLLRWGIIPLVGLLLFFTCVPAQAAGKLVIGRLSKEIQKDYKRLLPIAEYLGTRLAAFGITEGDVLVAGMNTAEEASALVKEGKIDLIFETPYSALRIMQESAAIPLMTASREGVAEYGSVLFARKDSGIGSLKELRGKVVAFEDPGSTSGFYLPLRSLGAAGLDMVRLEGTDMPVPDGKTGFVFADGELNVTSWVVSGKTAAGAYSESNWSSPEDNPSAYREQLIIIHRTAKVPRMLVLVRSELDPELIKAVRDLLVAMPGDPAGELALKPFKLSDFRVIEDPSGFRLNLEHSF